MLRHGCRAAVAGLAGITLVGPSASIAADQTPQTEITLLRNHATPLAIVRLSADPSAGPSAGLDPFAGFQPIAPIGGGAWVVRRLEGAAAGPFDAHTTELDAHAIVDHASHAALDAGLRHAEGAEASYWIIPADRSRPARRSIEARILASAGSASLVESDSLVMGATLTPRALAGLVLSGEILWAEPRTAPGTDGSFVREFGGANAVETVEGFIGAGVVVEVVDKGLFQEHNDLVASDPFLRTLNDGPTDHGTPTYGIIFGDGLTQPTARGMMPGQPGLFSSYLEIADRDAHLAEFANDFGGVIQSNSWGSAVNRRYTAASAAMDDSILRHGVLVFQSQSNRGNPDSRPEAWAKNAIAVGGVQGHGTLTRDDDTWAGIASTGPAIDGRIKPDLVLFNDGILTTSDAGEATHAPFTGTSAATPAVAGHAGIMIDMWRNGMFHGGDPLAVPSVNPSVAMSRAILINTATPYAFGHAADDLGRYRQGWGTPDLLSMWSSAPAMHLDDSTTPLAQGDAWTRVLRVEPGQPRAAFTVAWTDPPALPYAERTLINDLDLRVISPSGRVYLGNAGLHDSVNSAFVSEAGAPAATPAVPDRANPIENVFVESPEPGLWQVEVIGAVVAADTHAATPETDTPFAFVATGVDPQPVEGAIRIVGDIPEYLPVRFQEVIEFETSGYTPRGDGEVRVRWPGGFGGFPLQQIAPNRFRADMGGFECGIEYDVTVIIPDEDGNSVAFPRDEYVPHKKITAYNRARVDASAQLAWFSTSEGPLQSGTWERGSPAGGGLRLDPPFDADGDGLCWVTDNRAGSSGVVGGTAMLTSAPIPFQEITDPAISYNFWLASDAASLEGEDTMLVEISYDLGATWSVLATERSSFRWQRRVHPINAGFAPAAMLRFSVGDGGDGSHVEAAIDSLAVVGNSCPSCPGDFNGSGAVDLTDITDFLSGFSLRIDAADLNEDGLVDLTDLVRFVQNFQSICG